MQISVIIPALNEESNLKALLPRLHKVLSNLKVHPYEIIVVDGGSTDHTTEVSHELGARAVVQEEPGYGGALKDGFRSAQGDYVLTLDADLSHNPDFIDRMWA
ncbi:MAG TPA: glycosyltransferase family 2 protein, partial [Chloroflexi bacterium]|nr:glycosyltransferase family 2 protein [Chloroflexota bacterium]